MARHLPVGTPKVGSQTAAGYIALTNAAGALDDWHQLADFSTIGHLAIGADAVIDDSFFTPADDYSIVVAIAEEFTDFVTPPDAVYGVLAEFRGTPALEPTEPFIGMSLSIETDAADTENWNGLGVSVAGQQVNAAHGGSGILTYLYGRTVYADAANGPVTYLTADNVIGVVNGTGSTTSMYGTYTYTAHYGTGTVTNDYTLYIDLGNSSGTVTNKYGLYIADLITEGANSWNIFSAGATARNEFEGTLVVGGHSAFGADAAIDTSLFAFGSTFMVLSVAEEITDETITFPVGCQVEMSYNPVANSVATANASYIRVDTPLANTSDIGTMLSCSLNANHNGSGDVTTLLGQEIYAQVFGAGDATGVIYGSDINVSVAGGGNATWIAGINVTVVNGHAASTVSDSFGIYINSVATTGPTTRAYGLYIEDHSIMGTTAYNLYSEGATALNYIRGNLEVVAGVKAGVQNTVVDVSADGAIAITTGNTYYITKAGVAAMTLVDPTATTHDGMRLTFIATTANAHTLDNSAGSGFNNLGAAGDVATWGGAVGDGITIEAYQGVWYVVPGSNLNVVLA